MLAHCFPSMDIAMLNGTEARKSISCCQEADCWDMLPHKRKTVMLFL
jgi:hypothetical protein